MIPGLIPKPPRGAIAIPLLTALLAGLSACSDKAPEAEPPPPTSETAVESKPVAMVEVANPSNFARSDQPVYLSKQALGTTAEHLSVWVVDAQSTVEDSQSIVEDSQSTVEDSPIPSQMVDMDGDGSEDGLLVLLNFDPTEKKYLAIKDSPAQLKIKSRTQAEISAKQGGRWEEHKYIGGTFKNLDSLIAPPAHTDHSDYIRYEGPGIESDKVGYRVYLDWRNGFDIFGKTTSALALQNVGQDGFESYHHLSDWGMDILKVGDSLGAGGFGYWHDGRVDAVSKVDQRAVRISANGPLLSSFELTYKGWQTTSLKTDLSARLSMVAGSRLVKATLRSNPAVDKLAIGLVKHDNTQWIEGSTDITGRAYTYVASYGPQSLNDDNLGMALIFRKQDRAEQTEDEHSYVSVMKTPAGKMEYYFLAAWEKEPGGIKNQQEFIQYLEREIEKLTLKPRVSIKSQLSTEAKAGPLTPEQAIDWAVKLADAQRQRSALDYRYGGWDPVRARPLEFEYITGLLMQGYDELYRAASDNN